MTEEQAKKKWCPMVRISDYDEDYGNCACVASDCMMWRTEYNSEQLGYCGLAGKL